MGATSVTEEDNKETVSDDLSETKVVDNSVDEDKLAALKAMSRAKMKEKDMSSKIVAPKTRSVEFGVVGTGQAGCIDGDTNIFLTEYGICSISDFFYKSMKSAPIQNIVVNGDGSICIKLTGDKAFYTSSINPSTGMIERRQVKAVWKMRKNSKNIIKTESGVTLKCSKTHPSLVFNPKNKAKAYFKSLNDSNPLSVNERLVGSRGVIIDHLSSDTTVKGVVITPDIAWLLGLFAGDGSTKKSGNEISFYLSDSGTLDKTEKLLKSLFTNTINISDQPGCKKISISGLNPRLFFEEAFNISMDSTNGGFGAKTYTIDVPSCVSAASPHVRVAFLAGMIDSDGTVCKDWCESEVYTTSQKMADKLACLVSSIGGRAKVDNAKTNRPNEVDGFKVNISGKLNHGPLMSKLVHFIQHGGKKNRLTKWLESDQKSFTTSVSNIYFDEIKGTLKSEGGMKTVNSLCALSNVNVKSWSRGDRKLSLPSFEKVIDSLGESDSLQYIKNIDAKLDIISEIERDICGEEESVFFDLTVDEFENYLAGNNGFIFTHNSRLAESFYAMGYPAVVMNTAIQDLKGINVPDSNKLLLDNGVGGASRDLDIGEAAALSHLDAISELVANKLGSTSVHLLCVSLGGGSGAGSVEPLVDALLDTGKPLMALCVLPMSSEDAACKSNALKTLSKLAAMTQNNKLANLMVVDNARIETIFAGVGQMEFFGKANKAITEPLDVFNTLSSQDSSTKGLDPMEFHKIMLDGGGLTSYGSFTVEDYEDDVAIATAVVENLDNNLLASGLKLEEAKYVGFIVAANERVWSKISATSIQYAKSMVQDLAKNASAVFDGSYVIDCEEDVVFVSSIFSGLGLPRERVEELKSEVKVLESKAQERDATRKLTLDVGMGTDTASQADKIKQKIKAKGSTFGKFTSSKANVRDRRG